MNKNIVPSENQNKNKRKLIKGKKVNNSLDKRYTSLVTKFYSLKKLIDKMNDKIIKDNKLILKQRTKALLLF